MKIFKLFIILSTFLSGCDLIKYHPYDNQVNFRDVNATNIEKIESAIEGRDEFSFVWMGDSQRWYDETYDMVKYINKNLPDVDFVFHGGDISDFGMADEFEWIHEIMSKLKMPYIALIGNHDIIGNANSIYKDGYGATNFTFTIACVKFVCLDTNALEYNTAANVPNYDFISQELNATNNPNRTIVAMHAPPCCEQLSAKDGEKMHEMIKGFNNLMFCVNAHVHTYSVHDIFNDGITYYACDAMQKRSFILFKITKEGYSYEKIDF